MRRFLTIFLLLITGQVFADLTPVFLDSRTEITVSLPTPREKIEAKDFILYIDHHKLIPSKLKVVDYAKKPNSPATPDKVVLPGTLAPALGGNAWDPNDDTTRMTQVSPGIYELTLTLPGGEYDFKLAKGGSWAQNWGIDFKPDGQNIHLTVPQPSRTIKFVANFNASTFFNSLTHPDKVAPPAQNPVKPQTQDTRKIQTVILTLPRAITNKEMLQHMMLSNGSYEYQVVYARDVLSTPEFTYPKNDLGPTYSPGKTTFKVWSPVSNNVFLRLKQTAGNATAETLLPMKRGGYGVWYITVLGDLHGSHYQYRLTSYQKTRDAADIYARAATQDSTWSLVLDMDKTNPFNWDGNNYQTYPPNDQVIYELHVRDFTIDPASKVNPAWRGKYLGFTQQSLNINGFPTGIDYLKWLGVTDVHILPFQNFNPDHSTNYNWGYETTLFNVPEEQYSTNPADPLTTIREAKDMIKFLHQNGIRVIQDVVYNHTVPTHGERSAFDSTVPYYYFRTDNAGNLLNESGVGNAFADERPMARKFVRDSLVYWLEEYNLDGFRFDLLGMHTPESVKDWAKACRDVNPNVLLYGEPWTGGGPLRFGKGAQRNLGVAVFNDDFRNALRGELDGPAPGFIGTGQNVEAVKQGILGSINTFAAKPSESINYVSAHDNLALNDKIALLNLSSELQKRAQTLATATILLSQGIPFLEGGAEIGRTKGGNHNSYNAGDAANRFDWQRAQSFRDTAEITRAFIQLRNTMLPELRSGKPGTISFTDAPEGVVTYRINSSEGQFFVILNGTLESKSVTLPPAARWKTVQTNEAVNPPQEFSQGTRRVAPLTATVLIASP